MTIGLLDAPNQTLSVRLSGAKLFITLQTHNGVLYASTSIDSTPIATSVRCVDGQRITPKSMDAIIGGRLTFRTTDGSYPSYADFGRSCTLNYEALND